MTPQIGFAEGIHNPGPLTLGLFADLDLPSTAPPGAPTAVGATAGAAGTGAATVTWTAPVANGGAAINGYTATATPGGLTCTTTGATSCSVTGLTNGTSYTFKVVARNTAGTSLASTASNAVTPLAGPPGARPGSRPRPAT